MTRWEKQLCVTHDLEQVENMNFFLSFSEFDTFLNLFFEFVL